MTKPTAREEAAEANGEVVRHMRQREIDELEFRSMPQDGGQIVDVSYATDETWLYRHSHDRSDGEQYYTCTRIDDRASDDAIRFEPQNGLLPTTTGDDYLIVIPKS